MFKNGEILILKNIKDQSKAYKMIRINKIVLKHDGGDKQEWYDYTITDDDIDPGIVGEECLDACTFINEYYRKWTPITDIWNKLNAS